MKLNKVLLFLALFLLASAVLSPLSVCAVEPIETQRECELIIEFVHNGRPVEGISVSIYRFADVSANGDVTLCGKFADYPIDISGDSAQKHHALAQTLNVFAKKDQLKPDVQTKIDEYGFATVKNLRPGMFLIASERYEDEDGVFFLSPSIVSIPAKLSEEGEWLYSVRILPKCTYRSDGRPAVIEKKVQKIWRDEGCEADRPNSIEVALLRNGRVYQTVKLHAMNGWSYSWKNLSAKDEWLLAEMHPEGYMVMISDDGKVTSIYNTREPQTPPPDQPPPEEPDIPDTGMLWWPLPVLAVLGVVLILAGTAMGRGKRNEA